MMLLRPAAFATAVSLALLPVIGNAQSMSSPMLVQTTTHYTVTLTIGPAEEMISPADAMSGGMGEVMVNGGSMSSMPSNSTSMMSDGHAMSMGNTMMDQGMAANHHLEVH